LKLTARALFFLVMPPMMWAGNAVVGRLVVAHLPPVFMNGLRWALVALLLAPFARRLWGQGAAIRQRWAYLALIGALGVGSYNALQYLALQTSSPLNVTLIASSMPVWMMLVGAVCHGQRITRRQSLGALLSTGGVVLVLSRGSWDTLRHVQWVTGDLLMLLAALAWSVYSWQLARPPAHMQGRTRPAWDWAEFLWLQVIAGLAFALVCSGVEHMAWGHRQVWPTEWVQWQPLIWGMLFIAVGPSILAYWGWARGVAAAGPTVAAFFSNLTPVFAAVWSWALLGQTPQWYHPAALLLIAAGIAVSSTTTRTA
jgi:drug/metabolite transporter (DMT)-like permease